MNKTMNRNGLITVASKKNKKHTTGSTPAPPHPAPRPASTPSPSSKLHLDQGQKKCRAGSTFTSEQVRWNKDIVVLDRQHWEHLQHPVFPQLSCHAYRCPLCGIHCLSTQWCTFLGKNVKFGRESAKNERNVVGFHTFPASEIYTFE